MINFTTLLEEVSGLTDLEQMDAATNLFDFGTEKGYYNKLNAKEFNRVYQKSLNRILTKQYCESHKAANYLTTLEIISLANARIKEDPKRLEVYINEIMKNLRGKVA